jgi:hypothetical protein
MERRLLAPVRPVGFALKGGTAINRFYRDMPRLSVDIDLPLLSTESHDTALVANDATLDRIAASIAGDTFSAALVLTPD